MSKRNRFFVGLAMVTLLDLGATSAAWATGKGGTTCTPSAPRASIDNAWAWASPGSGGLPGQELKYAIDVFNNDVGCGSSSFLVTLSAPNGFSVSMRSNTITLNSGRLDMCGVTSHRRRPLPTVPTR